MSTPGGGVQSATIASGKRSHIFHCSVRGYRLSVTVIVGGINVLSFRM